MKSTPSIEFTYLPLISQFPLSFADEFMSAIIPGLIIETAAGAI